MNFGERINVGGDCKNVLYFAVDICQYYINR